jgi:hypothetical protein
VLRYRFIKYVFACSHRALPVLLVGLFCLGLTPAATVTAAEISVPLRVPLALLRAPLVGMSALPELADRELYRQGPCRYFQAGSPAIEQRPDGLHFIAHVSGRWALEIAGRCIGPSAWSGTTDLELIPVMGEDGRLRLRISRSTLRDDTGASAPVLGFIVNLSKRFINTRIEAFSYDLTPPREEVLAVLRDCVPPAILPAIGEVMDSLRLGDAALEPDTVTVPLILTIPDAWREPPPVRPVAAPLDAAAIRALEQAFEPLDAFIVFVVKRAGVEFADPELRERLFELLLASRYRLVDILSGEVETVSGDPLRDLFIADWEDLRALIAAAGQRGLIKGRLLEYALFINAGDVLLAIDRAAPGVGVEITADGLRRLARTLQPGVADPLKFDLGVDPELRRLFDFGPDAPPPPPSLLPLPESSLGDRLLARLFASAHAKGAAVDPAAELGKRLDRWVPGSAELTDYQGVVNSLLRLVADRQLQSAELKPAHAAIYRHLLPATALIESCWRQFVREDGKVTFLKSSAGSIGMMQINQHVWRGFYAIERLKWDVPYNVRAGAEILLRYLKVNAIPLAEKTGKPDHIPRAAYCVYNAGPKAVRRFLDTKGSARARAVDERLWNLYQRIAAGGTVDLNQCGVVTSAG